MCVPKLRAQRLLLPNSGRIAVLNSTETTPHSDPREPPAPQDGERERMAGERAVWSSTNVTGSEHWIPLRRRYEP
ncbi:hypothetical protein FA13DRAFT_1724522 [Coprinellus micaceus]|uniref:Uncharacterized protein n=1 Tax=Coprinellus micaceus TaxID=71717 RepID=A0A4Y7TXB2_COPMI|nr:hypothetical protein FA13DRAFT_1724522 [Coprinellus micaceus]